MRLLKPTLGILLPVAGVLLIVRFSSLSSPERHEETERDWIAAVYEPFDTLKTDPSAYRWPTDATTIISSAFAEFRRTHFHAGIDISTRGQQGYRVFAAREGYVSRLSVSPTGYGISLDVRHPDGFTTRYAHLQRFNDTLEAFIRQKQREEVRYSVDVSFDSATFPVRTGEVIAYTGETGIGAPHLHFEVRDPDMNPINPLRLSSFGRAVQDNLLPVFRSVAFEPLDYRSTVNGSRRPVLLSALRQKDAHYGLGRTVRISGSVGLSVRISDPFNGTWYKSGPYQLMLLVDDSLAFQARLDHIDASKTEQVALHFNWPMLARGHYQNLYVKTGNRMPLYDRLPEGAGVLSYENLPAGQHRMEIIARDFHGNESRLAAEIDVASPNTARVELVRNAPVRPLPDERGNPAVATSHGTSGSSDGRTASEDDEQLDTRLIVWSPEVVDQTGALTISKEFYQGYAVITLRTSGAYTLRPSVWVSSGDHRQLVDIDALDSRRYSGAFPLRLGRSDRVRIEAIAEVDGIPVKAVNEFTVAAVVPGRTTVLRSPDGRFSATFGEDAVYEPLYVRMEQRGKGYALEPHDVLLKRGAVITMSVAESDTQGTLGLYVGEEWNMDYSGRRTSEAPPTFSTRLSRMLSAVSVHRDSTSPTISRVRIRPSRRSVRVDFRVWDDLAGVRSDDIHVWIDDEPLIPVYDPYSRSVSAEGPIPGSSSDHTVRIRVEDRSANTSEISRRFTARSR